MLGGLPSLLRHGKRVEAVARLETYMVCLLRFQAFLGWAEGVNYE